MEQTVKNIQLEWKELVERLPSVLCAEFAMDEAGAIKELHVLSGMERGAKQIVRDIQSAMMARFGVEIDHRIISVAQIPNALNDAAEPSRRDGGRLICLGMDISIRSAGCEVSVELLGKDKQYKGSAKAGASTLERRRAAAEATLDAIGQYMGKSCSVRLNEVKSTEIAGAGAVMAAITMSCAGREELLIGCCISSEEEPLTAVRATLDALNRKIELVD